MRFMHYLNRLLKYYTLFFSFVLCQNPDIIELTKHVGYTLDAEENKYYQVFNDISNFESAQFFQLEPDIIEARISYLEYTRIKISRKRMDLKFFVDLQLRLNNMPKITEEIRESFRKNLTYLRTKDILTNIPLGQYVEVRHISGHRIKGTLLSFNRDRLYIQTPVSVKVVNITSMERITYREKIIDRPEWQKLIYSSAAVAGLLMMELWAPSIFIAFESFNWMIAILGYSAKYLNQPSKRLGYLSAAVYPIYILHFPIQYFFSLYILPLPTSAFIKFILLVLCVFGVSFTIYESMIKRLNWLRPLFGMKLKGK